MCVSECQFVCVFVCECVRGIVCVSVCVSVCVRECVCVSVIGPVSQGPSLTKNEYRVHGRKRPETSD